MDEGLFTKHFKSLKKRESEKETILLLIKNATSLELEESDIELDGKKILFMISSAKKAALEKRGIRKALQEAGYTF